MFIRDGQQRWFSSQVTLTDQCVSCLTVKIWRRGVCILTPTHLMLQFTMLHGCIPGVQTAWQRTRGGEGRASGARMGGIWPRGTGGGRLEPLLEGLCISQLGVSQLVAMAAPQPPSQNHWHHTQGDNGLTWCVTFKLKKRRDFFCAFWKKDTRIISLYFILWGLSRLSTRIYHRGSISKRRISFKNIYYGDEFLLH